MSPGKTWLMTPAAAYSGPEPSAVRVEIEVEPEHAALALYVVRHLLGLIGVSFRQAIGDGAADIRYARTPRGDSVWLTYRPEDYAQYAKFSSRAAVNGRCWAASGVAEPDLVAGAARLLTLVEERQVRPEGRRDGGVFPVGSLPPSRRSVLAEPLVEWHAQELRRRLDGARKLPATLAPRWPHGKSYGVSVTHDSDGPRLHQPAELAKAAAKFLLRRSRTEGEAFIEGVRTRLLRRPDPYFAYDQWAAFESNLGFRSAFYLYMPSSAPTHPRDPPYHVDGHPRWHILRDLVDDGFEVGVHAGIRASEGREHLADERTRLGSWLGQPIRGVRHHYWRLDWNDPISTLRHHSAVGYQYDCSIAWLDRPGLRAGTSAPYHPFDALAGGPLALLELPTTIMDGHLFEYMRLNEQAALRAALNVGASIARAGGLLNLDWHERTWCNQFSYRGWRSVLVALLDQLVRDGDAWFATPTEVADWWTSRERALANA